MRRLTCFTLLLPLLLHFHTVEAQPCSAAFTYTVGSNHTVTFYATDSTGTSRRWVFGDGTLLLSHANTITHMYAQPGRYEVIHYTERTGANVCHDSSVQLITIPTVDCDMTARFEFHKDSIDCKKIYFLNYTAPLTTAAHFTWNFGDGSSSTEGNPVHTYAQAGTYYVCLVSEAGAGCRKEYCDSIKVVCGVTRPRHNCDTVHVSYTYTRGTVRPNEIHFTASGNDSSLLQLWSIYKIGRGNINTTITTLVEANPTWTFNDTGWYRVCLVSITASLCRKEYCDSIHIEKIVNGPQLVVSTPNPAINTVTIEVTLDKPAQVMIRIMDGSGVIRAEFSENGATGNNRFTLPVERLNRGMYWVVITSGTHVWYSRFQKG